MEEEGVVVEGLGHGSIKRGDVFGAERRALRGCLFGQGNGQGAQFVAEVELGRRELLGDHHHDLRRQPACLERRDKLLPNLRDEVPCRIAAVPLDGHPSCFKRLSNHKEKRLAQSLIGPLFSNLSDKQVEGGNDRVGVLGPVSYTHLTLPTKA